MKQYYVTNTCLNAYLHMIGFDCNDVVHMSSGNTRFFYDYSQELMDSINAFKKDDFWADYVASSRVIDNARFKARVAFRNQNQSKTAI